MHIDAFPELSAPGSDECQQKASVRWQIGIVSMLAEARCAARFPFLLGSGEPSHLQILAPGIAVVHCAIYADRSGRAMLKTAPGTTVVFNGSEVSSVEIPEASDCSLEISGSFFVIRVDVSVERWLERVDTRTWFLFDTQTRVKQGPFSLPVLVDRIPAGAADSMLAACRGVSMGFWVRDIGPALRALPQDGEDPNPTLPRPASASPGNPASSGFRPGTGSATNKPAEHPPVAKPASPSQPPVQAYSGGNSQPASASSQPPPQQQQHAPPPPAPAAATRPTSTAGDGGVGELNCPVCWLRFGRPDVMHIASHPQLMGDPVLGESFMQRFTASRYNELGQALDPMGHPAFDAACPHCRRKLPSGFLDSMHHIISIVGAQSAGKTYFLSVLTKVLPTVLLQKFKVSLRDSDPSDNVLLNQMKSRLFSASSPQDAFLAKTGFKGDMYEVLPRRDRRVALPKPFVFRLSHLDNERSKASALVFYDNAGEHFEPGVDSVESPGAQHIASASGLVFLFDPLTNPDFRQRLAGHDDPQLRIPRADQQEVILAETEARAKRLLGLQSKSRLTTPLAVVIGKCDTWLNLLGPEPLTDPVRDGVLDHALIRQNSERIKKLLMELCPLVVGNAESISRSVRYFAASPLGCSPKEFTDAQGRTFIGPDPSQISPKYVEIPILWILSYLAPELVPSTNIQA